MPKNKLVQLNEQILSEITGFEKDPAKLPPGIIARVTRTICEIDKLNQNKRKYSRALWERVFNDPQFKSKIEKRTILGDQEHPSQVQVKLDKDTCSHIVSNMWIDEATNSVKADFDILPTEAGKFIYTLHEAGVQVGASTRAEGEMRECVEEATGDKYFEVIPESYRFATIDHTGDPSCFNTEPEKILRAVKQGYEAHVLDRKGAVALLERVNTQEAKAFVASISENAPTAQNTGTTQPSDANKGQTGTDPSKVQNSPISTEKDAEKKVQTDKLEVEPDEGKLNGQKPPVGEAHIKEEGGVLAKHHNASSDREIPADHRDNVKDMIMKKMGVSAGMAEQFMKSYNMHTAVNDESVEIINTALGIKNEISAESAVSETDKNAKIQIGEEVTYKGKKWTVEKVELDKPGAKDVMITIVNGNERFEIPITDVESFNESKESVNENKVKVSAYKDGVFVEETEVDESDLKGMQILGGEVDKIKVRKQDADKVFYSLPRYIHLENGEVTGVKYAYAANESVGQLLEGSTEFSFEYEGEEYTAEVSYKLQYDNNYGADADGRRGRRARFIEDVRIEGVWDSNNNKLNDIPGKMETAIERELEDQNLEEGVKEGRLPDMKKNPADPENIQAMLEKVKNQAIQLAEAQAKINELTSQLAEMSSAYGSDAVAYTADVIELRKIKENLDNQLKSLNMQFIEMTEAKKALDADLASKVVAIEKLQKSHDEAMNGLRESHKKALLEQYASFVARHRGLKISETLRGLLQNCQSEAEVDKMFDSVRDTLAESFLGFPSAPRGSLVIKTDTRPNPILERVGKAFEGINT